MMQLHAVVVTHNRREQLQSTLTALLQEPVDVVHVVDNGSCDGTAEMLAQIPDARLRRHGQAENLGGAGGFACGMAAAVAAGADWLVLMDDDGRPEPGAIARFRALAPAGPDAVAAAVRLPDGRICEMNRPGLNPFARPGLFLLMALGGLGRFRLPDPAYDAPAPRPADAASFVGLFLSAAAVRRVGLPDAGLFIYGDDVLYCLRLRAQGLTLWFDPRLRFIHDCRTLEGRHRIFRPVWKTYYHHRNLILVLRAAAGAPLAALVVPLALLVWTARVRFYPRPERRRYLGLLWRAALDGIRLRTDRTLAEVQRQAGPFPAEGAAAAAPAGRADGAPERRAA
ncbi:glycosyltransferase [Frigidibacter sp. MR17.24]|uniref:glycosyltransferase n=1 Tax=Frigidibacter sp. MR17.24 TaxID=3127345 RepID=UPI003012C313